EGSPLAGGLLAGPRQLALEDPHPRDGGFADVGPALVEVEAHRPRITLGDMEPRSVPSVGSEGLHAKREELGGQAAATGARFHGQEHQVPPWWRTGVLAEDEAPHQPSVLLGPPPPAGVPLLPPPEEGSQALAVRAIPALEALRRAEAFHEGVPGQGDRRRSVPIDVEGTDLHLDVGAGAGSAASCFTVSPVRSRASLNSTGPAAGGGPA